MIENAHRWYRENRERASIANRARYMANREARIEQTRQWYRANIEHARAWAAARRDKPEYRAMMRELKKRLYRQKPEVFAEYARRRRALKMSVPADLTDAQWRELVKANDHRCAYCGKMFERLTQDHVVPLHVGGAHTLANVVPACRSCNARKGRMLTGWEPMMVVLPLPMDVSVA